MTIILLRLLSSFAMESLITIAKAYANISTIPMNVYLLALIFKRLPSTVLINPEDYNINLSKG
jgi:hypothetical protein